MVIKFCAIFFLFFTNIFSQDVKDFSYSTSTEFIKQKKKFPFIKIVFPKKDTLLVESKDVIYFESNDKKLYLDIFEFKHEELKPAVLLIHGGGWKSGNKSMLTPLAQSIAQKGYNCFTIEYTLSTEAIYPKSVDDVLEAINHIKSNALKYNIDTLKIAIVGCSSGGQMASLIGTKYFDKVNAIVNIDGILAFHHPQSKEGTLAAEWLGGTYDEKPDIWQDASALNHVSKKTPPILFINSQYERFHAGRDQMIEQLNNYNIYSKIQTIKNSPHTFWLFDPWFEETSNYIVQFLNKQFK